MSTVTVYDPLGNVVSTKTVSDADAGHSGLRLSKAHSASETIANADLYIEDQTTDPDASGDFINVVARNPYSSVRSVFQVRRNGGVWLWDYLIIAPYTANELAAVGSAMLALGSDLDSATGITLRARNTGGHDLVALNDDNGYFDGSSNLEAVEDTAIPRRFTLTGKGRLVFGRKVKWAPAVVPRGRALALRNGDDTADVDVTTAKVTASSDIEVTDNAKGVVLSSPNGTRYRITVDDSGVLAASAITAPSTLAADTFNRANGAIGTAETGGAWTAAIGTWQVVSNQAKVTAYSGGAAMAYLTAAADYLATLDLVDAASLQGLAFRVADANNYWFVQAPNTAQPNCLGLFKVVSGAATEKVRIGVYAHTGTLGVRCEGSLITILWNGVAVAAYVDTFNQSSTGVGINAWAGAGNAIVDNLLVKALA